MTFDKLKFLELNAEVGHENIDVPSPADWLIRTNPAVLQTMKLFYTETENNPYDITPVFKKLAKVADRVNLKSLTLEFPTSTEKEAAIAHLAKFLKSQSNLEELQYNDDWTSKLLDVVLKELPKLNDLEADLLFEYDDRDEIIELFRKELPKYNENPENFKINGRNVFEEDFTDSDLSESGDISELGSSDEDDE